MIPRPFIKVKSFLLKAEDFKPQDSYYDICGCPVYNALRREGYPVSTVGGSYVRYYPNTSREWDMPDETLQALWENYQMEDPVDITVLLPVP